MNISIGQNKGEFMKSIPLYIIIVLCLGSSIFWACSDNSDSESEKGLIETMTDNTAKEAVNHIRKPMDKARSVKNLQENRLKEQDEAINDQ